MMNTNESGSDGVAVQLSRTDITARRAYRVDWMRSVVVSVFLAIGLSGCSLYFGGGDGSSPSPTAPDAGNVPACFDSGSDLDRQCEMQTPGTVAVWCDPGATFSEFGWTNCELLDNPGLVMHCCTLATTCSEGGRGSGCGSAQ